jgi:short-subunit dehydrogenase
MSARNLAGRVIIVTGASSGIGEATALELAKWNTRLVLVARREKLLNSVADRARAWGSAAIVVKADLSKLDELRKIVPATLQEFNKIDVLLNIAGWGAYGWVEMLKPEDVEMAFKASVLSMFHLTHDVLPHMQKQRSGHIINMSSYASKVAVPPMTLYASTKYAVEGFSDGLRRETSPFKIKVSRVHPGGVRGTEFNEKASARGGVSFKSPGIGNVSKEYAARRIRQLIERPRRELYIGRLYDGARLLNNLLPGVIDLFFDRWVRKKRKDELEE